MPDGLVHSAVNDPNVYSGPGTGYRLEGERWELLQALPHVVDPATLGGGDADAEPIVVDAARRATGDDPSEVVVAVGPAFADAIRETIADLDHREVLEAVCDGVREAAARRGSSACVVSPTSRSSRTTARASPARASRSACSRRARR